MDNGFRSVQSHLALVTKTEREGYIRLAYRKRHGSRSKRRIKRGGGSQLGKMVLHICYSPKKMVTNKTEGVGNEGGSQGDPNGGAATGVDPGQPRY